MEGRKHNLPGKVSSSSTLQVLAGKEGTAGFGQLKQIKQGKKDIPSPEAVALNNGKNLSQVKSWGHRSAGLRHITRLSLQQSPRAVKGPLGG